MSDEPANSFRPEQFTKMFEAFHVPGLDVKALMETQRKNLEALKQASQILTVGASDIAKKQTEIVQTAVQQAISLAGDMKGGDVAGAARAQQEFIKQAYETGLKNARELAEMVGRSNQEAYQTIERRVKENVEQLRASAQGKSSSEPT